MDDGLTERSPTTRGQSTIEVRNHQFRVTYHSHGRIGTGPRSHRRSDWLGGPHGQSPWGPSSSPSRRHGPRSQPTEKPRPHSTSGASRPAATCEGAPPAATGRRSTDEAPENAAVMGPLRSSGSVRCRYLSGGRTTLLVRSDLNRAQGRFHRRTSRCPVYVPTRPTASKMFSIAL